jgi:hypothetical protein
MWREVERTNQCMEPLQSDAIEIKPRENFYPKGPSDMGAFQQLFGSDIIEIIPITSFTQWEHQSQTLSSGSIQFQDMQQIETQCATNLPEVHNDGQGLRVDHQLQRSQVAEGTDGHV